MSTWIGSCCDRELARKAAGSVLMGQNDGVLVGSLTSVAVAQSAVRALQALASICDAPLYAQVPRGYQIASNMGATFNSTYAALFDSLPSSAGHQRQMITG